MNARLLIIAPLALFCLTMGCSPSSSPPSAASSAAPSATLPVIHRIEAVRQAKRVPPAPVPPVKGNGVVYSVPHFRSEAPGMVHNGGYLEATPENGGQRLWIKEIYRYAVDAKLESDVQDVFVATLQLDGSSLLVKDEEGAEYRVPIGP